MPPCTCIELPDGHYLMVGSFTEKLNDWGTFAVNRAWLKVAAAWFAAQPKVSK